MYSPVHTSFPSCAWLHGETCAWCFTLLWRCQIGIQFLFVTLRCEAKQECIRHVARPDRGTGLLIFSFFFWFRHQPLKSMFWADFTGICIFCGQILVLQEGSFLASSSWNVFFLFPVQVFFIILVLRVQGCTSEAHFWCGFLCLENKPYLSRPTFY